MRVAVVDVGTNSTRLLIADVDGASLTEVQRRSTVTRLGDGLEATGKLDPAAQRRVLDVLGDYVSRIAEHGATRNTALMTSAVRDARNGAAFAEAVRALGLDGRILSGDEEARLTFGGATATRPPHGLAVVDIGGGSTEIVMQDFHVSTQIGVVRHGERHLATDPPPPHERAALAEDVRATLTTADLPPATTLVAVAGTATSAAAIDLELAVYASERVEGRRLPRRTLAAMLDRLASLPLEDRRRIPGLHPDRAPTIVAGLVILLEVLDALHLGEVEVSDRDILWGAALEMSP